MFVNPQSLSLGDGTVLNETLVARRGLDNDRIGMLRHLHARMATLKASFAEASLSEARALVREVEDVEFEMQEAWGWTRDRTRHSHWWQVEGCRCPSGANEALTGQGVRLVAAECPHHDVGDEIEGVTLLPFKPMA